MKVTSTSIADVFIIEPKFFEDLRGSFFESFNQRDFNAATGANCSFVQDNHSRSKKGVLRGLHYQLGKPQGKLVRVVRGAVFDVAVDIRLTSPTFGKSFGMELNEDNNQQLWVPPGFAHGFSVLSDSADLLYKTSDYYIPSLERCISWDDPDLGISWRLEGAPILSVKDGAGQAFKTAEL